MRFAKIQGYDARRRWGHTEKVGSFRSSLDKVLFVDLIFNRLRTHCYNLQEQLVT